MPLLLASFLLSIDRFQVRSVQFKINMDKSYEELRDSCINLYGKLYKDTLVFDICKVDKKTRLALQQDEVYLRETKAKKASLFLEQLDILDGVIAGAYVSPEKPVDMSGTILKALEMKNKLLLEDLNVNKDESSALNVTFTEMKREDFESLDTVVVSKGKEGDSFNLPEDFAESSDSSSFDEKMKRDVKERMKIKKGKKDED